MVNIIFLTIIWLSISYDWRFVVITYWLLVMITVIKFNISDGQFNLFSITDCQVHNVEFQCRSSLVNICMFVLFLIYT